jgi:hypothetical protein
MHGTFTARRQARQHQSQHGRIEAEGLEFSPCHVVLADEVLAYVISANVHRHHLNCDDKRNLIAKLIKANLEKSDRQIAKLASASPTMVGTKRVEMQTMGDVFKLDTSTDTRGRKQPRKRARKSGRPPQVPIHDTKSAAYTRGNIDPQHPDNPSHPQEGDIRRAGRWPQHSSLLAPHASRERLMTARLRLPNLRESQQFALECNGLRFTATVSRFADGGIAEIFLQNHKSGSQSDANARDAAIAGLGDVAGAALLAVPPKVGVCWDRRQEQSFAGRGARTRRTGASGATRRDSMQDAFDDMIDEIDGKTDNTTTAKPDDAGGSTVRTAVTATTALRPSVGHELVNPFARYGAIEGSSSFFNGDFLKLDQKLGFVRGQDKTPADTAQGWVANMAQASHGFIRYARSGDDRVEHDVALIAEQPVPPLCKACGRTVREHDEAPKRCDWRPVVYLPLRPLSDPSDVVCFSGSGKGARVAVADLCKIFGRPGADRKGRDLVVLLQDRSFPNTEGGTTVWPVFKPIGAEFFVPDTPAPEVRPVAVSITPTAKALPNDNDLSDIDDEIPF